MYLRRPSSHTQSLHVVSKNGVIAGSLHTAQVSVPGAHSRQPNGHGIGTQVLATGS